jgi:hypothetical protein
MSMAASAENTMKFLEVQIDNNNKNNNNTCNDNNDNIVDNSHLKNNDGIFFKNQLSDSDDDMVVIILEEDASVKRDNEKSIGKEDESEKCANINEVNEVNEGHESVENECGDHNNNNDCNGNEPPAVAPVSTKKKYIGIEVYTHFQHIMESKKMYPLLPCNMISSFAHAMEYVEYFDIPSEERKKLVTDLVKILAYSNNDHGSRECFDYFAQHNMVNDIMQTIIDSTKSRYDINRFPHTNRKFVLSCVSLTNKIKIVKPSAKMESLFEEFKLNLCGLKRFFKMREKDESKQT